MPNRKSSLLHRRRFALTLVAAALVAVVVVPNAAALRFTDASRLPPDGAVGSRYFHQFEGVGGCGPALPYQFRILNGSLPPGLTLSSGGLVSGTPTQGGNWSFWVELSDQDPPSADWCRSAKSEEEFTINVGPKGSVPDASPPAASGGGGGILSVTACDLPVVGNVCDAVAGAVKKVAAEAGEFVMRGVTAWVTNAAVWVAGKVGELIENTSSPDLRAGWFEGQYQAMLAIAGALALLMLMLAVIQSVIHQDIWMLARAAFGYLPMAFVFAGVAIAATGLLVAITDDMSAAVVSSLGTEQSDNLLQAVGDAYKNALDEDSGIPLFGVFLGAIILALGAFVLWLEMIIRDAAIYICVFFLPLTFVAMVWPATSRWARRLVELLIVIILAKFVIISILTLATAAIVNTGVAESDSTTFEQMLAGSAILVLAAWSPFALLRMIPMMELAAASVVHQRSAVQSAAGSAGVHSPAVYMRQAMDRHSRASTSGSSGGTPAAIYIGGPRAQGSSPAHDAESRRFDSGGGGSDQAGGVASTPGRAQTASPGRSSARFDGRTPRADGPARPVAPHTHPASHPGRGRLRRLPRRDRDRLNRRSTDARLPNRRLIDARRRSRRLTGVHRSTEVKRERRRVSALPLRPARAAGADRFATAGPGDRDRLQSHAGG